MNPNGKVDRKLLPEPGFESRSAQRPRNEMERLLATLWEEVLGVEGSQSLTPDRDRPMRTEAQVYERVVIDVVGRTRWIRARCVPDLNLDGTVRGEYVVGHDITDLKLAQDALAARESQLRAIMDGVPAPVAYIDR